MKLTLLSLLTTCTVILENIFFVSSACMHLNGFFNCVGNATDSFETPNPKKIIRIDIAQCRFPAINPELFRRYVNLKSLRIIDSQVESIHPEAFSSQQNLTVLDLSNNKLKLIAEGTLRPLRNLTHLSISSNNLAGVNFGTLRGKVYLNLNNIEQLNKFGDDIEMMVLDFNKIKEIGRNVLNQKLKRLHLSSNVIEVIDQEAFRNTRMLQELILGGNTLTKLPDGLFGNLKVLRSLQLEQNQIKFNDAKLFNGLGNLQRLDISYNTVELDKNLFDKLQNLRSLKMNGLNLTKIPYKSLKNMKSLNSLEVVENDIRSIDYGALRNVDALKCLVLRHNKIRKVQWNALEFLKCFDISDNYMKNLDAKQIKQQMKNLDVLYSSKKMMKDATPGFTDRVCFSENAKCSIFYDCEKLCRTKYK